MLTFVRCCVDQSTELDRAEVAQEESSADHPAELAEGEVEPVLAAVGGEPAQDGRGQQAAGFHRERDAQHVRQVRVDQIPVDGGGEQLVDVLIAGRLVRANLPFSEWGQVLPNPRLCQALIDRLTDRAHIIETGTESFQFRRTLAGARKAA